jgi:hypothetical protein
MNSHNDRKDFCGPDHFSRRTLLKATGAAAGMAWLTPLAELLALNAEKAPKGKPAKSVIFLWLAGGPSQLETFDPHPGKKIAYGTGAVNTSLKGVQFADGMPQSAAIMNEISLIRSVTSQEGDHERASYNMKTGWRPDPTLVHPSIGAVINHQLPNPKIEIPNHISIIPDQWPGRGGYLGAEHDAFKIGDPKNPVPDVSSDVPANRESLRRKNLSILERGFARGRRSDLDAKKTLHQATMVRARKMMTSDQLTAFDVGLATKAERESYGDSQFGRGCLAARRLIETGVRCVEVTLKSFDTHFNNHENHTNLIKDLDPAFSTLITDLKQRGLLDSTIVICGGEFGRTPKLNPFEGRDHWPHGFSVALAGGGIRKGHVIGSTDPTGVSEEPENPVKVEDIHATVQHLLGIDYEKELDTPVGRPMALSDGFVVEELIA